MGKILTATLLETLINDGVYLLDPPAPIPEWKNENGPHTKIRIGDILHTLRGLRFRAPHNPDFDPAGDPDHRYVYTGAANSFQWAAKRPLQWAPNGVGRYRNSDPVTGNCLIRLAVEKRGKDYHSYPQRALSDKLGMHDMVLETDPYGNFLLQECEFGSTRDSVIFICRKVPGTGNACCPRVSRNSSARWPRAGLPTAGRSTAAASISTELSGFQFPKRRTTWSMPAAVHNHHYVARSGRCENGSLRRIQCPF